jgi:hypothetical protein
MRTTPLLSWSKQAADFDRLVRVTAEEILGCTFSTTSYDQACLSPSVGGLGLRRVAVHADGAFAASWYEAMKTCDEKWSPPCPLPDVYRPQSVASTALDVVCAARLSSSSSLREARRIDRLSSPHACSWVTAGPSSTGSQGLSHVGPPPPRPPFVSLSCLLPLCMQTVDIHGDHAVLQWSGRPDCDTIGFETLRWRRWASWAPPMRQRGPGDVSTRFQ